LISLVILLLCSRILLCIFILLVARHGTTYDSCSTDDRCRTYDSPTYPSSPQNSSASHINLLIDNRL